MRVPLQCLVWVTGETIQLSSTGNLLCKATVPRPGDVVDLPNMYKQTEGSSQNVDTKKHVSNGRKQNKIPEELK